MNIPASEKNGVTILALEGAILGGPEANALNEELHRLLDAGKTRVIISLEKVTHMNSSGLGMLIGGYTTMKHNGGELKLAALNETLKNLIRITKLNTVLTSYDTIDEAVASFGG
jgi:anti-sigma B factor antagonist